MMSSLKLSEFVEIVERNTRTTSESSDVVTKFAEAHSMLQELSSLFLFRVVS